MSNSIQDEIDQFTNNLAGEHKQYAPMFNCLLKAYTQGMQRSTNGKINNVKDEHSMKLLPLKSYARTRGEEQCIKDIRISLGAQMEAHRYEKNKTELMELMATIERHQLKPEEINMLLAEYTYGYVSKINNSVRSVK